jgi:D-alanyl-lipoteichoic acid acyltransferase DltB (MBOAT superfamily)
MTNEAHVMTTFAVASDAQRKTTWAEALVHALVVLVLCGAPTAALVYFAVSFAIIAARPSRTSRWRTPWSWTAVVTMIGLGALMRDEVRISRVLLRVMHFDVVSAVGLDPSGTLRILVGLDVPGALRFVGLSYCFLRASYAMFDDRDWTLLGYLRYWFFVPTFISGPVLTPDRQFLALNEGRRAAIGEGSVRVLSGILRIAAALMLSYAIPLQNRYTMADASEHWPVIALWLGAVSSGVWLYLNFSGYSDVFIGVARMCGVRAPENFDNPLAARDLTAFWQRWHISLGDWLRTNVYDPMSRRLLRISPKLVVPASLLAPVVTMLVCGAWHAFAANFLLWGLAHGAGLAIHTSWKRFVRGRLPVPVRTHRAYALAAWALTQGFAAAMWTLFLPVQNDVTLLTRLHLLLAMVGVR